MLDAAIDQFAHDAGVDLEEVIAGHARFACTAVRDLGNCVLARHLRGIPAGMMTTSAPEKAFFIPSSGGRKAVTFCVASFSACFRQFYA
jgi:hypothetical protein